MIASPAASSGASSSITLPTTPAGTIIHTARGASSLATRSATDVAAVAPSFASAAPGAGSGSYTTHWWPAACEAAHDVGAHAPEADHAELHHDSVGVAAASAAPTMPARLPSSATRTSHPGSMLSMNLSACFTIPPPSTISSGQSSACSLREVRVEPLRPVLPGELLLVALRVRRPGVGDLAVDLEVPELGVRDERAVVEQRGADAGADGDDDHDTAPIARGAEARFGDAGRVGVVQHRARAARRPPDHRRRVRADPRGVDVRGGAHRPAHHDGRQRAPDRTVGADLADDVGDRRRRPPPESRAGASRCRIQGVTVPVRRSTSAALMPVPPTSTPMRFCGVGIGAKLPRRRTGRDDLNES